MRLQLNRFSIGIGDRFGRQGQAQLEAIMKARDAGIDLDPVWNKSHREHSIIGTSPADVRHEADAAVRAKGYKGHYFVDADHINLKNVDEFIQPCDFFTIDVADFIGVPAETQDIEGFVKRHADLCGSIEIPGLDSPLKVDMDQIRAAASRFLAAVRQAGRIYRYILSRKGQGRFITEVSMDEADRPQGPVELLLILAGLADEGIPVQTIAPRFSGRFNKGVDYVGDLIRFQAEFGGDVAVVGYAQGRFGLPDGLKLSIHSGSDKFSIYPLIKAILARTGAGLHLKTAGTTWLEELTCLAQAGGEGLAIARQIYAQALDQMAELCRPYATVINIDPGRLPSAGEVAGWSADRFAMAIRHDPTCPGFNPHMRQLMHVAYRLAAQIGRRFLDALDANSQQIAQAVTYNLLERHIRAVFPVSG